MNNAKVDKLLKLIDSFSSRHHKHEILSDCFEIWAICISQTVDKPQYAAREQRYLDIVKKYDKHDLDLIGQMFGEVWLLLSEMPTDGFDDYLGQLYMASGTGSDKAGQFFTPYCVSKLSAEITIRSKKDELLKNDIITFYEPACGSGGMILAAMDTLQNDCGINYAQHAFVVAGDIDSRCVHMCYLQLSLAGVPAIVEQRNALTMELIGGVWKTPAYLMQYMRFRNVLNGTVHEKTLFTGGQNG